MFFRNYYEVSRLPDSASVKQSVLNHLFLPHDLPSSANDDALLAYDHQNEYKIVESINDFFASLDAKKTLPIFTTLKTSLQHWLILQNPEKCTVVNLQSSITKLAAGDFLSLYFRAQNAAILIEIDEHCLQKALISAWQVALPTETITSSLQPHLAHFPVPTFRLSDRSQLQSRSHCEVLADFMKNTIEGAKSTKASNTFDETREVPLSHYVCHWWLKQFSNIKQENRSIPFTKKHRDQIRWKDSNLPFRRSGLWMTIKVVFQTILTQRLGTIGTIVYKLLITHLLTYVLQQQQPTEGSPMSTDLLVYCLRKIGRRLVKIEKLVSSISMNEWMENVMKDIKQSMHVLSPKSNWQYEIKSYRKQTLYKPQFHSLPLETYQHACLKLKRYLNEDQRHKTANIQRVNSYGFYSSSATNDFHTDEENTLPSITSRTYQSDDNPGASLTRVEIWVQSNLEGWINKKILSENDGKRFGDLQSFYENYQRVAVKHYYSDNQPSDPVGYSRFILTSLIIICAMHRKLCADQQFERLKFHAIRIPNLIELFEYLVLPYRHEMMRARELYDYFQEFNGKPYSDLLSDIKSPNSFGVYFANQSKDMNETLEKINAQIEQDKADKVNEVNNEKKRYEQMMTTAQNLECECVPTTFVYKKCERCEMIKKANDIKVHIYESPMPSERESALAVIFELQMPNEIRCYRDILWQFVNRPNPQPSNNMYEWLDTQPHSSKLRSYYKGSSNCQIKLVSSTKSITQSHYSAPRPVNTTPLENYFCENSLKVQISPTKSTSFQDECRTLTPQLTHSSYKDLQFSLDSTLFMQNRVICDISKCSLLLKPTEFIEFGSFRSGHCLQWWNLLTFLETDSLSVDEESVAILIHHALLQNGPMTIDPTRLISSWCPEAHQQLLEDHFVDELIVRLERHLKDCESNWQNELILTILTIIVMRIFTICNATRINQMRTLVFRCRSVALKWIELIFQVIQNPSLSEIDRIDTLRDKLVIIGTISLLTFSVYAERNDDLQLTDQDVVSLLKISTTVRDNIILSKKTTNTSVFMRNFTRSTDRILISIIPAINGFLQKTSCESLNQFVAIYWTIVQNESTTDGQWKKTDKNIYDGRYDGQYGSKQISIDLLQGTFLVNKTSVGFLPDRITSDALFQRVFGTHIFEVQSDKSEDTYVTKYGYHADGKVYYQFHCTYYSQRLTVQEIHIQTNDRFELIPLSCFEGELPDTFVSNYSHWKNLKYDQIEFRPIRFQDPNFLTDKSYILRIKKGYISTNSVDNLPFLINRSSPFFKNWFSSYFIRLDEEPYVYMLRHRDFIDIRLSRLGIAFKYDMKQKTMTSREYSDMYVDEEQCCRTLTGLTSGLLLSPSNKTNQNYLWRKLIIPYGQVQASKSSANDHQIVTIDRKLPSSSLLHQYFVYILNDRLRILQPTDSPTGWLYLALLHALTSHSLPDYYTGMTGMERSFQLLYSAGCWSDQPFDTISLNILLQLAVISPKVNYYPTHRTYMAKVEWNLSSLPHSLQHFGYYLIVKKLIETSEQWKFMHPASNASHELHKLLESKKYNETLLAKLYWDYRDSYNPTARLSTEMETEIRSTSSTQCYQPVCQNYSTSTNYSQRHLVYDLYSDGDVDLKDNTQLTSFPLSRWLTSEYQLKNIWIGLLKLVTQLKSATTVDQQDKIEQFEMLLSFLHYISIQPFYLQLLWSVLKTPTERLTSFTYPNFTQYENIQHISFQWSHFRFLHGFGRYKRNIIEAEIQHCFNTNSNYTNQNCSQSNINEYRVNMQLQSLRANKQLHSLLSDIQNQVSSVTMIPMNCTTRVTSQRFTVESFDNHFQIPFNAMGTCSNEKLLHSAQNKFMHRHSDYFIQPIRSVPIPQVERAFPNELFPSTDAETNPLSDIAKYFKDHLNNSWTKFQSTEEYRREYPSIDEIHRVLNSFRRESTELWSELKKSITSNNQWLWKTGLIVRIVPTILISLLHQLWLEEEQQQHRHALTASNMSQTLTSEQRTLLGGILVNWVVEQQIERALHCANHQKWEDFEKEISNVPHVNWIPSEQVPWLIMQLEMNITIREIQIQVARHMMQPQINENDSTIRNVVMQMNMGEGKTSVILPMLALGLASSLVRIIVLKSLFPMNYQSLRYKLGGLLNRRVLSFACQRDMNFDQNQANEILRRLQQGLVNRDIVLTSPEYLLSFDLLTIDKCRRQEFDVGRSMLSTQRWLKIFARDILDESDEILHVKYQLIYSVGSQRQVDGGVERWKTIQMILNLVKQHTTYMIENYTDDVFYKPSERSSAFPEFRLLTHEPFPKLCERIVHDWLNEKSYRQSDQQLILSFILNANISLDSLNDRFPDRILQQFLILRGLLSAEVLFVALKKRYRVNYGVNPNSKCHRLIAVPFRAKDVAAENTEFGHPDVAIVLTLLSYYYRGLDDTQLQQCFKRLNQDEDDPELIYNEWLSLEIDDETISSIKQWKTINLKDTQQRTGLLFPTLRCNISVVNYFLNHFVFPREAKQFPNKLVASAWDLSSSARTQIITGFSGTNDTQLLLPVQIRQCDLPELQKTDAIVLNNLLRSENENYQCLSSSITSEEILKKIVKAKPIIQVIIDVGALFVDGTNRQIAVKWLDLSEKETIDYVVYFELDSLLVCDRQYQHHSFFTSPAGERLDRCLFYLDEIHTRGTDFKFPDDFRAAVTLGNGLTKDRLVQAAMRMRKLGKHHWLSFWSSNEVHLQIQLLKNNTSDDQVNLTDILRWVYENTQHATWDGLHHWATQSFSFQRKVMAVRNIDWNNTQQHISDLMMNNLQHYCLEDEVIELRSMYGPSKTFQSVCDIYNARYTNSNLCSSTDIHDAVIQRLKNFGGRKQLLAQLLDEEQQRELEQEMEKEQERQQKRPPSVRPYQPILHPQIKSLGDTQNPIHNLSDFPSVFSPLSDAFLGTSFYRECQPKCWQTNIWVSSEFKRVTETQGESLDTFLRPARWIVLYRNEHIIFISAHEANWLMSQLHFLSRQQQLLPASNSTLRLLLPRTKRDQSIFVNTSTLTMPPSIMPNDDLTHFSIPVRWLVELFIFNGTLYFENAEECVAYCRRLGICPQPRSLNEREAFEKGWIAEDGYVEKLEHRILLQLDPCRFSSNPLAFVRKVVENRNHVHAPLKSHVGSIIRNALKLSL